MWFAFIYCLSGTYLKQEIIKCEDKVKSNINMRLGKWSVGNLFVPKHENFSSSTQNPQKARQ